MTQPDTVPTAGDTPEELAAAEAAANTSPTAPEQAPEPSTGAQVLLSVDRPFFVAEFVDGSLTIDRTGVLVDETAVESIVASASASGIALKVGKSA